MTQFLPTQGSILRMGVTARPTARPLLGLVTKVNASLRRRHPIRCSCTYNRGASPPTPPEFLGQVKSAGFLTRCRSGIPDCVVLTAQRSMGPYFIDNFWEKNNGRPIKKL